MIQKTIDMFGKDLTFDEPTHVYTYKGEVMTSATTVLKDYFPFDSEGVKEKLSKSNHRVYGGMTPDEIQEMWSAKAQFGTDVHQFVEDYLNGVFVEVANDRMVTAQKWLRNFKFEEVYPEVKVVAPEWGISGMIDCLVKKDGKWWIYDWKTDKAIRRNSFDGERCTGVLSTFENCNYNKFTFQLGLYRMILELVYDIQIAGCKVVHFDEDGSAREYTLPYYSDYIGLIIKLHQQK